MGGEASNQPAAFKKSRIIKQNPIDPSNEREAVEIIKKACHDMEVKREEHKRAKKASLDLEAKLNSDKAIKELFASRNAGHAAKRD